MTDVVMSVLNSIHYVIIYFPCSFIFFFFFYCYSDHRDLHSFPTRRSSDLDALPRAPACRSTAPPSAPQSPGAPRSEEHTSELQSPCNLVCRLLLEKKKIIINKKALKDMTVQLHA